MKDSHKELIDRVLKKIGQNILLFQQIEKGLKIILPFMSHPTSKIEEFDWSKRQQEVDSATLGNLVTTFIKNSDCDTEYFAKHLKRIVYNRNQLVHHFGGSEGLKILDTEQGCKDCLSYLENQRQDAFLFYRDIQFFCFGLTYAFREVYGKSNPEINLLYDRVKAKAIGEVKTVNVSNPLETVWENTKIVKLLRLAEQSLEKVEGMTSLSAAGKFIKNKNPQCTPKNYGVKTLKGILNVSGLFKIRKCQNGMILYKSNVSH
ncbi:MAG: OST-HTH/LOTUS domain-containing protein [Cyanobacteriota bacterium]|nr:OST-HTH/LOTUS domain-containing protein [Cyanobacteriota bacterium]